MKILKHTVSLLCALALLLSLAPAALAETTEEPPKETISISGSEDGECDNNGNSWYKEPDNSVKVEESGYLVVQDEKTAVVEIGGKLTNEKIVRANADGGNDAKASITAESITNEGYLTMEVNGKNSSTGTLKTTGGDLENNGTVILYYNSVSDPVTNAETKISVEGSVINGENGVIWVESNGSETSNASITATGDITNYGTILVENNGGREGGATIQADGEITNYGTIQLNGTRYYGVNYIGVLNGQELLDSALASWKDGEKGKEIALKENTETKEGHDFFWMIDDQKYKPGDSVTIDKVLNIKAYWQPIPAPDPTPSGGSDHSESDGKPVEHIIQHVEVLKVLDADRREMEIEKEYLAVARTSFNRLVVLFSWDQMTQMEEGEHLFYIVMPDGAEVEYTLTIW